MKNSIQHNKSIKTKNLNKGNAQEVSNTSYEENFQNSKIKNQMKPLKIIKFNAQKRNLEESKTNFNLIFINDNNINDYNSSKTPKNFNNLNKNNSNQNSNAKNLSNKKRINYINQNISPEY